MAIPPRLHVFMTFMLQFILVMVLLGSIVPWLHTEKGLSWAVLVPATVAGLVVLHFMIAVSRLLQLARVRTRCAGKAGKPSPT